ncbi:MAG: nitrate reductase cytochrome c-type subunit [Burkholderiales bacterium]|nr:nitrate reductase cytochrome c-type subunit [Burkholderiales bacterium]MCE7877040.1 nitrate reductase cytochrome c-type subunit [Betaproteobacteria bacterium PRO3]
MMRAILLAAVAAFAAFAALAQSPLTDRLRGTTPVADETRPPPLGNAENRDLRRERSYSMQPPTIPHKIDGYQVDLNVNACLGCHSRGRAPVTQAVAVSVSHYMDRDGNFLAEISPRRYFCEQCHVPQEDAKPLVGNRFVDVDEILRGGAAAGAQKK